jgi:hypothetical protein
MRNKPPLHHRTHSERVAAALHLPVLDPDEHGPNRGIRLTGGLERISDGDSSGEPVADATDVLLEQDSSCFVSKWRPSPDPGPGNYRQFLVQGCGEGSEPPASAFPVSRARKPLRRVVGGWRLGSPAVVTRHCSAAETVPEGKTPSRRLLACLTVGRPL